MITTKLPVIIKHTVRSNIYTATYIGCLNNLKKRYSTHKDSFKNEKQINAAALLQGKIESPDVKLNIIRPANNARQDEATANSALLKKGK